MNLHLLGLYLCGNWSYIGVSVSSLDGIPVLFELHR